MDSKDFPAAENPEEGGARQNAKDLFTFLTGFAELRTRTVRSVDQYESVLWLSDVPREKGCFCAAWDGGDEEGQHGETWLEIGKPRMFPPPPPGLLLEPWLIAEQITDSSREMPEVRDEISVRGKTAMLRSDHSNGGASKISRKFAKCGPSTLRTSGGRGRNSING